MGGKGLESDGGSMRLTLVLCWSVWLILAGCSRLGEGVVIPRQETAEAQFLFANDIYQRYQSPLPPAKRRELANEAVAAFRMVIEEFPQAENLVARSKLGIALILKRQGKTRKARESLKELVENYPDNDYVQVYGLYELASLYDDQGRHQDAKDLYREVVRRFGQSSNEQYRKIAAWAQLKYQKVWKE